MAKAGARLHRQRHRLSRIETDLHPPPRSLQRERRPLPSFLQHQGDTLSPQSRLRTPRRLLTSIQRKKSRQQHLEPAVRLAVDRPHPRFFGALQHRAQLFQSTGLRRQKADPLLPVEHLLHRVQPQQLIEAQPLFTPLTQPQQGGDPARLHQLGLVAPLLINARIGDRPSRPHVHLAVSRSKSPAPVLQYQPRPIQFHAARTDRLDGRRRPLSYLQLDRGAGRPQPSVQENPFDAAVRPVRPLHPPQGQPLPPPVPQRKSRPCRHPPLGQGHAAQ